MDLSCACCWQRTGHNWERIVLLTGQALFLIICFTSRFLPDCRRPYTSLYVLRAGFLVGLSVRIGTLLVSTWGGKTSYMSDSSSRTDSMLGITSWMVKLFLIGSYVWSCIILLPVTRTFTHDLHCNNTILMNGTLSVCFYMGVRNGLY